MAGAQAGRGDAAEADRAIVTASLSVLKAVELRILAMLAQRLCQGQAQYGPFDFATDSRNMRREATEELVDAAVYTCAARLIDQGRGIHSIFSLPPLLTDDELRAMLERGNTVEARQARKRCLGVGVTLRGEEVFCHQEEGHLGTCFPTDLL